MQSGVPTISYSSTTPHPTWPPRALDTTGQIYCRAGSQPSASAAPLLTQHGHRGPWTPQVRYTAGQGPNHQLQQHHSSPNMATAGPGHHRSDILQGRVPTTSMATAGPGQHRSDIQKSKNPTITKIRDTAHMAAVSGRHN
jgi:hypothetical protein